MDEGGGNSAVNMKHLVKMGKSYQCNQCNYTSLIVRDVKRHEKIHSGEKPYKCNQCDYATSWACSLKAHMKIHSGEKPNKCNQCDFASSQAGHLRRHLKTHSRTTNQQLVIPHICHQHTSSAGAKFFSLV